MARRGVLARGRRRLYHVCPMLERAVFLDLVTTGPDPRHHRVLEVAAVRVVDGREEGVFHGLVNPGRAIPTGVAKRTGISEREVSAAPELRYVLPDLFRFLGADPIVTREAERAVRAFLEAPFGCRMGNRFLDLAGLEFLTDPSPRRRPWLAGAPGVPGAIRDPAPAAKGVGAAGGASAAAPVPHRALERARAHAEATARLLERARGWDPALRAEVARVVRGSGFPWTPLYEGVPPDAGPLRLALPEVDLDGRRPSPPPPFPARPIDIDAVTRVFDGDGALSRIKPGFEYRAQQAEMAAEVAGTFNEGRILLVEAGTGVGKSLAYLVPALLWARENGCPVIVSTHTKVLQGQLDLDLDLLRELLDWDFRAVVVKGRSNYLCLHRWQDTHQRTQEPDETPGASGASAPPPRPRSDGTGRLDERETLAYALHWVQATQTGDIRDEMPLWMQERLPAGFLGRVTIDAEHCLGRRCPQYTRCFVTHARERAREAHLVIVNHSLLMECLLAERDDILPHRGPIVIDEAHHLENVATAVLSAVSSRRALARVLREIWNPSDRSGLLPLLFRQLGHDPDPAISKAVRELALEGRKRVEELGPAGVRFFSQLQAFLRDVRVGEENGGGTQHAVKVRVTDPVRNLDGWRPLREANAAVHYSLAALYGLLHHLDVNVLGAGGEEGPLARVPRAELDGLITQLGAGRRAVQEMLSVHAQFFDAPQADRVYWLENEFLPDNDDGGQWEASLHAAPLDVGPALESYLFARHSSVVLTSATLTTSSATDEFRFFRLRLGLDRLEGDRVRYVKLLSPFDYGRQVLFLLISDLPPYSAKDRESRRRFFDAAREFLPALLRANHGGTLVLCTSHEQLDYLHGPARDALAPLGIDVLRQSRGVSTRRQVERFREDPDSVLFGTYGLWEGIDVPGDSLDGLAVVKLPFDPPTDPLVESRREQTIARGLDGNHHYYYPLAIMRLKQGFGRLIRSTRDRGVFVVLDNRLATRAPYAKQFLNSLPPGMQSYRLVESVEALRLIEMWRRPE